MLCRRIALGGVRLIAASSALPGSKVTSRRYSSKAGTDHSSGEHDKTGPSLLVGIAGMITAGLGTVWYMRWKEQSNHDQSIVGVPLPHISAASLSEEAEVSKVSLRERRYKDFSSLCLNGEPYMTPRDFLESVTLSKPRSKWLMRHLINQLTPNMIDKKIARERQYVNDRDLKQLLKKTLPRSKGSKCLFRDIWNDGKKDT